MCCKDLQTSDVLFRTSMVLRTNSKSRSTSHDILKHVHPLMAQALHEQMSHMTALSNNLDDNNRLTKSFQRLSQAFLVVYYIAASTSLPSPTLSLHSLASPADLHPAAANLMV